MRPLLLRLQCIVILPLAINAFVSPNISAKIPDSHNVDLTRKILAPSIESRIRWPRLAETTPNGARKEQNLKVYGLLYKLLGVASVVSWTAVSTVVLTQPHPDPQFMYTSTLHNVLTLSQALCFPVPVLFSVFVALQSATSVGWKRLQSPTYRRLNLGLALTSVWLAACSVVPKYFSFGYDLIPSVLKKTGLIVHSSTALLALIVWTKSLPLPPSPIKLVQGVLASIWKIPPLHPVDDPDQDLQSSLYAIVTCGMLYFSASPLIHCYPRATVPSILGKRLSRSACGFYGLAAIVSYCLKDAADRDRLSASTFQTLARGLFLGSLLHTILILLKVVGLDGGGYLLPGRGLWEVYPAMLAVPVASTLSVLLHMLICLTTASSV